MDSEKFKQPEIKEGYNKSYTSVILGISLIFVSIALVLLTVLGSVYVVSLQKEVKDDDTAYKYQVRHKDSDMDILEDREHQIELIRNKNADGRMVSMVALDYDARMISIYVPEEKKCFMIGGIIEELGSFEDDIPISLVTTHQENTNNTGTIRYVSKDKSPVKKTALLTKDLQPYCTNTNTFWLERRDSAIKQTRNKRRVIVIIVIIIVRV